MPTVWPGLDSLRAAGPGSLPATLKGRRTGLLTNHTGRALDGTPSLEVLRSLGIEVAALFSPEHGPAGTREGDIESGVTDEGLPVHSLYGETRRPTETMLRGLDTLVCDLQDAGARFYTYATTLAYLLEECSRHRLPVVVLDRPNPLGGETVEGPGLDDECRSFIGHLNVPVRHGLTLGELARLHQHDAGLDLELRVITVKGWRRAQRWPETALTWPAPSPNLPDYTAAAWYPGTCLLEFSGVSVGRGTAAPFQIVGAPWLDPERVLSALPPWLDALEAFGAGAIVAEPVSFVPAHAAFAGIACQGIRFETPPADPSLRALQPVGLGLALLAVLHRVHRSELNETRLDAALKLLGSRAVLDALLRGDIPSALNLAHTDAATFRDRRAAFLLYE